MAARKAGLKGQESKSFSDFVANPPDFAKMEAIRPGKDAVQKQLRLKTLFLIHLWLMFLPRSLDGCSTFGRWAAETPAQARHFGKIKANTASSGDIASVSNNRSHRMGGVKFVNDVLYENVDPVRMEFRNANGDRVRFGGLSPCRMPISWRPLCVATLKRLGRSTIYLFARAKRIRRKTTRDVLRFGYAYL